MMSSWVLWWMIFMLLFFATPIGYGWGYRKWGAPYPRYIQRRRGQKASADGNSTDFDHESWRWGGDLVWLAFLIGVIWLVTVLWWV
jgi:hypothetical protein